MHKSNQSFLFLYQVYEIMAEIEFVCFLLCILSLVPRVYLSHTYTLYQ